MTNILKIGITDCKKYRNYNNWFINAPFPVAIIHLSSKENNASLVEKCDGIVLSGGEDVHPNRYNKPEVLNFLNQENINPDRDAFEFEVIKNSQLYNKPILGICRGMQLMNVFLGGTLIYDIPTVTGSASHLSKDKTDSRHKITTSNHSLIQSITNSNTGNINSAHHQAIDIISDKLIVTAQSTDGIVEALEWKTFGKNPWMLLVQWHPERMPDQENPFAATVRDAFLKQLLP